ncbi:MAG: hypothetical protein ACRDJW_07990 [Thermomicrobiales bacterium]
MEFLIIFLIVLLILIAIVLIGTTVMGISLQPLVQQMLPARTNRPALPTAGVEPLRAELTTRHEVEAERLRGEARTAIAELDAELGRLREGLRTTTHEHERHLVQLRERHAAVDDRALATIDQGLRELRGHLDAEVAHVREGVGAALAAIAARQDAGTDVLTARRREAIADLDRKLAKMEASALAVTNPVLLPGERFVPPAEFPPESLRWETWKEVGDAAFAFADAFNQNRIYLDDALCRDLSAFVVALRERLTISIYPNLQPKPSEAGLRVLRDALERLGDDIPAARERLERAFRERE